MGVVASQGGLPGLDPGRSCGRVRTRRRGQSPRRGRGRRLNDFNAAGKTDENHHPDPDGAIAFADDPFGFFGSAAADSRPGSGWQRFQRPGDQPDRSALSGAARALPSPPLHAQAGRSPLWPLSSPPRADGPSSRRPMPPLPRCPAPVCAARQRLSLMRPRASLPERRLRLLSLPPFRTPAPAALYRSLKSAHSSTR